MGVATLPVPAEDTSIHNYNSKTRKIGSDLLMCN